MSDNSAAQIIKAACKRALFWRSPTSNSKTSIDMLVKDYCQQLENARTVGEKFLIRIALHQLGCQSGNAAIDEVVDIMINIIQALDVKSAPYPRSIVEMGSVFLFSCETLTSDEKHIVKAVLMYDWERIIYYHTAQPLLKECLGTYNSREEFVKKLIEQNGGMIQGIVPDYQRSIDMLEYKYTFIEYSGLVYVFNWPFINLPMPVID